VDYCSLLRADHCYLDTTDVCYFETIYKTRRNSDTRRKLLKFKRGDPSTILFFARLLARTIPDEWLEQFTFVPMPPSKGLNSPVRSMVGHLPAKDIRDLVLQIRGTPSAHTGWRLSPKQRERILVVDELQANPTPNAVVIVDDIVTTGAHFRAMKRVLQARWPGLHVIGLFLSRTSPRRGMWYSAAFHSSANNISMLDLHA
jgi:predicted amidophosphoribosyltransferase